MDDDDKLAATPAETPTPAPPEPDEPEKVTPEPTTDETAKPEGEKPEGETEELDEDGEPKKKKPSGAERAKRRLQLAQAELDRLANENEELKRRVAPATRPDGTREGRPGIDREPTEADFPDDYFALSEARTAWRVTQALEAKINAERTAKQQALQRELHAERLEAYEENKELVRERVPDFDKVVASAKDVTVKPDVVEEILASEKSALLQYHLAKNPDKVRELNQMSGRELAREIGRLESRIHLPTAKKATEASPPPSTPKGGAAPQVSLQTASMDDYVALRRKQEASSR